MIANIIIIILWVICGLISLIPYLNPEELGAMGRGKQMITLLIFVVLGPVIGFSTFLHLLLFYYFGGEGSP